MAANTVRGIPSGFLTGEPTDQFDEPKISKRRIGITQPPTGAPMSVPAQTAVPTSVPVVQSAPLEAPRAKIETSPGQQGQGRVVTPSASLQARELPQQRIAPPPAEVRTALPPRPASAPTVEPIAPAAQIERGTSQKTIHFTRRAGEQLTEISKTLKELDPKGQFNSSTVLNALVSALHGSLKHVDLSQQPAPGGFGTEQWLEYRKGLTRAFARAIAAQKF